MAFRVFPSMIFRFVPSLSTRIWHQYTMHGNVGPQGFILVRWNGRKVQNRLVTRFLASWSLGLGMAESFL